MKKLFVFAGIALLGMASTQAQPTTLADWTFESLASNLSTTTPPTVQAASGTLAGNSSYVATGSHSGVIGTATYSSPTGNGSARSFSANGWNVGDYWLYSVNTLGYTGIQVSFDQVSSATGPKTFQLQYSTDGTTFTPFSSNFNVATNAGATTFAAAAPVSGVTETFDLSSITALNNASSTVYFRVVDESTTSENGGTVAAAGTDRQDNFIVSGTAIPTPEPSTFALLGLGAGVCALLRRKSRQ